MKHDLYPLPAQSIATVPDAPQDVRIWLDQTVTTSPIELAFIAIGHVALGVIIALAFL
jgi:hypothetical protein